MPADAAPFARVISPIVDAHEWPGVEGTVWRFLWFAPNAGNWITYQMEHRVANALVKAGHEVTVIQCDGVLSAYCQVMAPQKVAATAPESDRLAICRECRFAAGVARDKALYRTVQLSESQDFGDIEEVDRTIATMTSDSWSSVTESDLPVGRYAAYTTLLHHKTPEVTSSPEAWAEYRADCRGALLAARAIPKILDQVQPTHGVVYNALYPANRVFSELVRRRSSLLVNLSAGPSVARRYETLAVYDGLVASQTSTDSSAFAQGLNVPLSELEVGHVEHHLEMLMSAADPWVYSAAVTRRPALQIREALGVRPDTHVVTVIVSSPDETRASLMVDAEFHRDAHSGYSDVPEFIRACIDLARSRPAEDFVFRLHPRLAPNKRERLSSPDLLEINRLLSDLPTNAIVNYPSEDVSLYDLILISQVAINQSSSAGLEFLSFGVPVVQYDPMRLGAYPVDFGEWASRGDGLGLQAALARSLETPWDIGRCVFAYRWYAGLQIRSVVPLTPLLPIQRPVSATSSATPMPHPLGRFLPRRLKERLVLEKQRRQRAKELDRHALSEETVEVLLESIRSVRGKGEVWEPFMLLPNNPSSDAEEILVRASFTRLVGRMSTDDTRGMGLIRNAELSS